MVNFYIEIIIWDKIGGVNVEENKKSQSQNQKKKQDEPSMSEWESGSKGGQSSKDEDLDYGSEDQQPKDSM